MSDTDIVTELRTNIAPHLALSRRSADEIERLRAALKSLLPILDAVKLSAGLRGNQIERVEKARALLRGR